MEVERFGREDGGGEICGREDGGEIYVGTEDIGGGDKWAER
jgi:hypothetical protein